MGVWNIRTQHVHKHLHSAQVAPELLETVLREIPHSAATGYQRKHYLKEGTSYEHYMKGTTAKGFKKKMLSHYLAV